MPNHHCAAGSELRRTMPTQIMAEAQGDGLAFCPRPLDKLSATALAQAATVVLVVRPGELNASV